MKVLKYWNPPLAIKLNINQDTKPNKHTEEYWKNLPALHKLCKVTLTQSKFMCFKLKWQGLYILVATYTCIGTVHWPNIIITVTAKYSQQTTRGCVKLLARAEAKTFQVVGCFRANVFSTPVMVYFFPTKLATIRMKKKILRHSFRTAC